MFDENFKKLVCFYLTISFPYKCVLSFRFSCCSYNIFINCRLELHLHYHCTSVSKFSKLCSLISEPTLVKTFSNATLIKRELVTQGLYGTQRTDCILLNNGGEMGRQLITKKILSPLVLLNQIIHSKFKQRKGCQSQKSLKPKHRSKNINIEEIISSDIYQ